MVARLVVDCRCQLGEGPLWSAAEAALYWVDVPLPSAVHRWSPSTGAHAVFAMPEMVLSLAECSGGGLLVASARRLNLFDPTSGTLTALIEPEPDQPGNRINDGGTDATGRFWFGTLHNNFGPNNEDVPITQNTGSLYSFDMNVGLRRHDQGIDAANTIAFSPETQAGLAAVEAICAVDGLGGIFIGPNDLCFALGKAPQADPRDKEVVDAIGHCLAVAKAAGKHAGVYCPSGAVAARRARDGFDFVLPGNDAAILRSAATSEVRDARGK